MTAKDITLDLIIRYGFQVLGALIILIVGAFLARWIGWDGALALVGAVNLVGGGVGIARAASRLKSFRLMDDTAQELNRSVTALAQTPVPAVQPATRPRESGHGR